MSAPTIRSRARSDWPQHVFIWLLLAVELLPLYMMAQVSLKDNAAFIREPWLPPAPGHWHWENWAVAFRLVLPYVANSVFVAVTGTALTLVLALAAAYFFARQRGPLATLGWSAFLLLLLMPGIANLVPLFSLLRELNLLNTLAAIVAVGVAGGQAFCIFVLRGFIEDLPKDLFEAAEIDGASHFQRLRLIVVPLCGPVLGTLAVLTFLNKWNEFLLPLIVLRDRELFTLGVGLVYLDGEYVKHWGHIMAAYFLAALPLLILFLFTMRLFVRGLSQGALKG
jgi:multiple sugar transport system permease protein